MKLPAFPESPICKSRIHCVGCRSTTSAGHFFRLNLSQKFSGIGDGIDCPYGVPWDVGKLDVPDAAQATAPPGPGDRVKSILSVLGIEPGQNCGCEAMRRKMNAWGWSGCWRNRQEITDWFAAKARERGIGFDAGTLWRLLVGRLGE